MANERPASSHAAAGISAVSIVEAALGVIREDGVAGLTMRSLAERLGVRTPSLYHHVRNKEQLLALVAQEAWTSFTTDREAYERVGSLEDWIDTTDAGAHRLRDFYAVHPGLAGLTQDTATPHRDRAAGPRAALVRAQIDGLVRLGVPAPQAREAFETCAYWTLAAVAADTGGVDDIAADVRFRRGLEWLLSGLLQQLRVMAVGLDGDEPSPGTH